MSQPVQSRILRLYNPHPVQRAFHESSARYRVASWGRQSGKSSACLNELLRYAWEHPGVTLWYLSPTYEQARVQYRRLVGMLWNCSDALLKKNQTELRVKIVNQAQIVFKSGEVLENLRGETLHGCVIDEVRDQPSELWPLVIRPMLATTNGWAAFISTPSGFDSFYDLAELAKSDSTGRWAYFQAPSTANPLFSKEEYEAAKRDMSEGQFAQEILAEFRDIHSGKAYLNFGEWNLLASSPFAPPGHTLSPYLPITVALDFNVTPMAWTLGQFRSFQSYWHDEIWLENSHTQEASEELVARVRGHAPGVIIIGDATGKSHKTSAAGQSDYDILCNVLTRAGIRWSNQTPDSNPAVKDRVNTMNARLRASDGTVSMWMHPTNCPHLRRDCERVVWKAGAQAILDQVKDKTLTHSSDGVGYAQCALAPLQGVADVGTLRVIRR